MHRIPTNVLSGGMFTDERAGGISRINSRLRSNVISQQTQVTQHLQIIKTNPNQHGQQGMKSAWSARNEIRNMLGLILAKCGKQSGH
jgi:hypothetical protein